LNSNAVKSFRLLCSRKTLVTAPVLDHDARLCARAQPVDAQAFVTELALKLSAMGADQLGQNLNDARGRYAEAAAIEGLRPEMA